MLPVQLELELDDHRRQSPAVVTGPTPAEVFSEPMLLKTIVCARKRKLTDFDIWQTNNTLKEYAVNITQIGCI